MNTKRRLPRGAAYAIVGVALLLVALAGYFALISPQRSRLSRLSAEIADTQTKLDQVKLKSLQVKKAPSIEVADLYRLAKAMPDRTDMPGILLTLDQMAKEAGITLSSISPGAPIGLSGFTAVPINVAVVGSFYDLSDFLFRLRKLVSIRRSKLDATGRLFTVDSVDFEQGTVPYPDLQATLTMEAFVYGSTQAPGAAGAQAGSNGATSVASTHQPTTSPPPPQAPPAVGATAFGATN